MKLSIIIPVYNEESTLLKLLKRIKTIDIDKEIIIVNDGSTDRTGYILKNLSKKYYNKIIYHKKNLGKGAAIITASKYISGDAIIIQDADLEYNPKDNKKLINPIKNKKFKIVYGSRVLGKNRYHNANNFISLSRIFFNQALTLLSNLINNQNLTDAHTCYKVFDKDIFLKLKLKEKGFSFCPEVNSKIARLKLEIKEVQISYKGRSKNEGKKISFMDGIYAVLTLIKYGLLKRE